MTRLFRKSFRSRLMVSFLAVSLIPLCLCCALLVKITSVHLNREIRQSLEETSASLTASLDDLSRGFAQAASTLQQSGQLAQALAQPDLQDTIVYNTLHDAAEPIWDICVLRLYDLQGNAMYSSHSVPEAQKLNPSWGILYAAGEADGEPVYIASGDDEVLLRAAVLLKHRDEPVSYVVMELSRDHFDQLLEEKHGNHIQIFLLNRFWRPVYSSSQNLEAELSTLLRQQLLSGKQPGAEDPDYLYSIAEHTPTQLILVLQQSQAFSANTLRILYTVSLCWALVCVIISVLISIPLSRQISQPIRQLQQAFGKLEQDDLSVQVSTSREDELGQLAQSFNHMVGALNTNRQELVQNQKELDETKLRMLQAQLNPHFLCNTLDTMKWISKINKVPQVALMSTNLADILRFCISDVEFVPLQRELEILERYIEIQRIRLSDQFTFEVEIPEELLEFPVPKMILQPIVENAIIHGLTGVENSRIRVKAEVRQKKYLCITIEDNGCGLPDEMVGKPYSREILQDRNHLGLYNVQMILRLHYQSESELLLDRGPEGIGTSVTAVIPLQNSREETTCLKF